MRQLRCPTSRLCCCCALAALPRCRCRRWRGSRVRSGNLGASGAGREPGCGPMRHAGRSCDPGLDTGGDCGAGDRRRGVACDGAGRRFCQDWRCSPRRSSISSRARGAGMLLFVAAALFGLSRNHLSRSQLVRSISRARRGGGAVSGFHRDVRLSVVHAMAWASSWVTKDGTSRGPSQNGSKRRRFTVRHTVRPELAARFWLSAAGYPVACWPKWLDRLDFSMARSSNAEAWTLPLRGCIEGPFTRMSGATQAPGHDARSRWISAFLSRQSHTRSQAKPEKPAQMVDLC